MPYKTIGFTGSRKGMTTAQIERFIIFIDGAHYLLHGDCVGADAQADYWAKKRGLLSVAHPPTDPKFRAYCQDGTLYREEKPYLERDRDIVDRCDALFAAPDKWSDNFGKHSRSGTWYTIRYAKRISKPVVIVYPDGSVEKIRV